MRSGRLHSVNTITDIDPCALSIGTGPSREYRSEIWDSSKCLAGSLESILLGGEKRCTFEMLMKLLAVTSETLDRKLKWW